MKTFLKDLLKKLIRGKDVSSDMLNFDLDFTLLVKMNSRVLARLYFEKESKKFCLVYTESFKNTGLKPFHTESNDLATNVDTGIVYRSSRLWYPFALRLPKPDRKDYEVAMRDAGLNDKSSPLEVLGKLSNYSISQPWKLEVIEGGKASA